MSGKNETAVPASRRRRFRGLTKMAAAVSAATSSTSPSTTTTAIATASAARPLAIDGNWRLGKRRGSRVSVGRYPKRKEGWEV